MTAHRIGSFRPLKYTLSHMASPLQATPPCSAAVCLRAADNSWAVATLVMARFRKISLRRDERGEHELARDSQEVRVMTQAMEDVARKDPACKMEKLISELARCLVDSPETVSVEAVPDGDGTILRLKVAASDLGKVIGRQGRTARSLRTILSAASMKLKHRFSLDISEELQGTNLDERIE